MMPNFFSQHLPLSAGRFSSLGGTQIPVRDRAATSLAASRRNHLRAVAAPHSEIRTRFFDLQLQIQNDLLRERLLAILSGFFGILAAVLVMVGLYGVVSYLVTRRRTNSASASPSAPHLRIIALFMHEAGRMLLLGTFVGAALSPLATRGASSIPFGLKSWDPATIACFLPASATCIDPVDALRRDDIRQSHSSTSLTLSQLHRTNPAMEAG